MNGIYEKPWRMDGEQFEVWIDGLLYGAYATRQIAQRAWDGFYKGAI